MGFTEKRLKGKKCRISLGKKIEKNVPKNLKKENYED